MRQIVIDEINQKDIDSLKKYLKGNLQRAGMAGIYWLTVPDHLLGEAQLGHDDCGPFVMAIEIADKKVVGELLVRSSSNLHCTCICYADREQREFMLDFLDGMLRDQGIIA